MLALLVTALCADAVQLRVEGPASSPVLKVLSLIKRIRTTIETEGKEEAAEYDKYACFCKDEASNKQYAIDKAHELEARLSARIEEATGMKESTDQAIETLEGEVAQLDTDVADANSTRTSEHSDYLSHKDMLERGISGIENATKTVKAGLAGPALLHQLAVEFLQKVPAQGDNAVLETLETLKVQFGEAIIESDHTEIETQQAYEMMQGKRANQKTAKLHNIEQHNATSAELSVEIAEREQAKSESETARASDEGFLADLSAKCEAKATAWDARSKVRAGELIAMAKAIELLAPAADTYGATDDQATALGLGLAAKKSKASKTPVSFLQVASRTESLLARHAKATLAKVVHGRDRVISTLSKVTSGRVQAIATAAKDSSMDEVASMVQELIDDLVKEGEDADAEATWCEEEMTKAQEARNESLAELTELNTTITVKSSERDELTVEIATLAHELAEIAKALNEETVLYNEEKVRLAKKLTDSTIGEKAVSDAISVLEEYYQGIAVFAQKTSSTRHAKQEPIDASVETFSNDQYGGSQSSASHVIGLLNEIKDDFTQAISDATTGEQTADSDFADYQSESESSTDVKTDAKETKEEEKAAAELAISDAVTAEENAEKVLAQREELIEKIKPGCTAAGIAAADRATQREAEMSALGEALDILRNTDFNSTGF